jgi:hypothetical protein
MPGKSKSKSKASKKSAAPKKTPEEDSPAPPPNDATFVLNRTKDPLATTFLEPRALLFDSSAEDQDDNNQNTILEPKSMTLCASESEEEEDETRDLLMPLVSTMRSPSLLKLPETPALVKKNGEEQSKDQK